MALNVAQYLAPLNSAQVLSGYVQGVKQGTGITIAADGTISLNPAGAATLGFLTSSTAPAPIYNWTLSGGNPGSVLTNDGLGNLTWDTNYVPTITVGQNFPHTGAAVIPAGATVARPASASTGCIRYNTDLGYLEFYNGTSWLPFSPSTGGVFSFVSNVTPTPNAVGDIWLDTNTNQAKIWDGVSWTPTTPIATALVPGRVKIGSNVQVAADGTISILPTTGVAGGVSNAGVTTITDNVTSSSIDSALSANQGRLLQNQIAALLISNNLTFAGIISGAGVMTYVTPEGLLQGFAVGSPLPTASTTNAEYFVIVESAGGFTPPGGVFTTVTQGDWFLSSSLSWQFLNVGYDPPAATTGTAGIVQLATNAETQAGTNTTKAITPDDLSSRTATTGRTGIAALATQAQANAGTDDTTIITPLKLATVFSSGSLNATNITLNPNINGKTTVQSALADAIYNVASSDSSVTVTETATGQVDLVVTQASTTQNGGGKVATSAQALAGTNDTTIVTPLKMRAATVYQSDFNAKGDLISASANDTPAILSVGSSGQFLTVDSTTTTGLALTTPGFVNIDDVSASFDGVTTSFPIKIGGVGYTPTTATNLMVFLGGVPQIPGAANAYTISGSNISFTTAPPTGTTFYAVTVK